MQAYPLLRDDPALLAKKDAPPKLKPNGSRHKSASAILPFAIFQFACSARIAFMAVVSKCISFVSRVDLFVKHQGRGVSGALVAAL